MFSSRDTVPESTVRRENISPDIMRKNRPPSSAPRRSVRRPTWRSFLQNTSASSAKASKNRTASRLNAVMVPSPSLLNTKDVLRAMITQASSSSARFSDMVSLLLRYHRSIPHFSPGVKSFLSRIKYRLLAIFPKMRHTPEKAERTPDEPAPVPKKKGNTHGRALCDCVTPSCRP